MSIVEKWFNQLQWNVQADYINKSPIDCIY